MKKQNKKEIVRKCAFCNNDANGYIDFSWEKFGESPFEIEIGYRYPCCLGCLNDMLPFIDIPRFRILKQGIFKEK